MFEIVEYFFLKQGNFLKHEDNVLSIQPASWKGDAAFQNLVKKMCQKCGQSSSSFCRVLSSLSHKKASTHTRRINTEETEKGLTAGGGMYLNAELAI